MNRPALVLPIALMVLSAGMAVGQDTGTDPRRPAEQMTLRYMTDRNVVSRPRVLLEEWELYLRYQTSLGLSIDQVEELQDIRIDYLRDTADTRGEYEIAVQELEDLLMAEKLSVNAISRKLSDVYDYEEELDVALVEAVDEARDVLTASQLEQAAVLRRRNMRGMMTDDAGSGMMRNRVW